MNKIILIIQREYLTRVKKKSFIVMTILGPILMAALMIVPAIVASMDDDGQKTVAVIQGQNKKLDSVLRNTDWLKFEFLETTEPYSLTNELKEGKYYAVLYNKDTSANYLTGYTLLSDKQPAINVKDYISNSLQTHAKIEKLKKLGIDNEKLKQADVRIDLNTIRISDKGELKQGSTEMSMVLGFISAFVIYMFVFIYGSLVMRGVIEEKTNRIVEIIVSSVKPFQLMMGKILGIACVALTQFLLWVVLTLAIFQVAQSTILSSKMEKLSQVTQAVGKQNALGIAPEMAHLDTGDQMLATLFTLPWGTLLASFLFFFVTGYLLYAAIFAAIGSAVDNEADTQQFMLPVTIPLVMSIVMAQAIIKNPEGDLAFWMSIIPLTSPVIMMIRIPFGVPLWQLALSMSLLILGFIACTWFAARIYRTGILMYGKKASWGELWKWMRY